MRQTLRRLPVAVVLAAGLTGLTACTSSGDGIRDRLADITVAANDRDADALREAADDLIDELRAQQQAGELGAAEADRLTQLANQVRADADLIDQDLVDLETARREAEEAARRAAEEAARREASEQAQKAAEEAARKAQEKAREAEEKARELLEKDKKDDKKDDEQDDD